MKKQIIFITLAILLTLVASRKRGITKTKISKTGCKRHPKVIISAINILLSITAFFGNLLIILALQKSSSLHLPSKLLLGCLASTDIFVGLVSQPLYVYGLLSPDSKSCYNSLFHFKQTSFSFCGLSLLTITAISADRLLALQLGLRYRQVVTLRRTWALVVSFWLSTTALAIPSHYKFSIARYIICVIISLCIATSTFCYIKIYLTLHHQQAQVQGHIHQGQPNGGGIPLNVAWYRKTVSSAFWVQITLVACYLPYATIFTILTVTGMGTPFLKLAREVTYTVLMFNSTLNPFLYCWKMREVRQAVKDTFKKLTCFST